MRIKYDARVRYYNNFNNVIENVYFFRNDKLDGKYINYDTPNKYKISYYKNGIKVKKVEYDNKV